MSRPGAGHEETTPREVTELLLAWNSGHKEALDQLMPLVIEELRNLARVHLRDEGRANALQPTALINEVYLKLVDRQRVTWENRAHFFGFAATTMRRILVDRARAKRAEKRGHGMAPVTLEAGIAVSDRAEVDILVLDQILGRLAELDARQARLVELRFFAGLTLQEAATVLEISRATANRDWSTAKAWLHRELSRSERQPASASDD